MRRWLGIVLLVAVVVVLVGTALAAGRPSPAPMPTAAPSSAIGPTASRASPSSPSAAASKPPSGTLEPLAALLGMLRIAPERRTGYERSLFVHWIDADGDGCDTRHEVLITQAIVRPHVGARCALTGGRWLSLYDGRTVTDPAKLEIDHVVALAEAWDSGAHAWSPARREAYANDLGVPFALLAVSSATNQSKSDDDPADWLPPAPAARCPFLGDWIAIKARWSLTVDQREHDALAADIAGCGSVEMPYLPAGS